MPMKSLKTSVAVPGEMSTGLNNHSSCRSVAVPIRPFLFLFFFYPKIEVL